MQDDTEIIRRIYAADGDGAFIEIGPDGDGLNTVEIRTDGQRSQEWFGNVSLRLSKDLARSVGKALIAAADE